jgi:hypothetical protein
MLFPCKPDSDDTVCPVCVSEVSVVFGCYVVDWYSAAEIGVGFVVFDFCECNVHGTGTLEVTWSVENHYHFIYQNFFKNYLDIVFFFFLYNLTRLLMLEREIV